MVTKSDSFGALSFWTHEEGYSRERVSRVAIRRPPHGNVTVYQTGGRGEEKITLQALIDEGSVTTLRTLVNSTGTLVCPDGSFTALLESYRLGEWYGMTDERDVTLVFWLDSD